MHSLKELKEISQELTLLYLEDEKNIRQQLSVLFEKLFGTVFSEENGQAGLETYKKHHETINLVISDIKMPIMNGLEMAREIKMINPNTHIIFLTAHNDMEFFAEAIEIGVDGFIMKPVDTIQLANAIYKSVNSIKMELELDEYHARIEEKLIETVEKLEHNYTHDSLTECRNREKLRMDLKETEHSCLLLINIDNFSAVNSTYGYRIGDSVLKSFTSFIKKILDERQPMYRLAGDEFIVLWKEKCTDKVRQISEKIINRLNEKEFDVDDCKIHLTCTIGIAEGYNNGLEEDYEDVLIKAHAAMEEIRQIGKNRYQVYSPDSPYIAKQKNNITWMHKVSEALKNDTIVPYFQPIIDNATLLPVKYECLSRIKDSVNVITPNHFIEPARLVGLLPKITEVMIEKSFKHFSKYHYGFTINITEDDLKARFLPDLLNRLTTEYNIDPKRVTLEILENISAQGSDEVLSQLLELKTMGFLLALDDFGSDKSNFYRLQKMNVDIIKIDGGFIEDITTNVNNEKIIKTIVLLAQNLGCDVVAEYVHSEEVFHKVRDLGIKYSQGYYFGEPKEKI